MQVHVDMKSSERMAIGDVAAAYGLEAHVLRHWEEMGVLLPGRTGGGQRSYSRADVVRVALILLGKRAGLSLDQIRVLLENAADRAERLALYEEHCAELRQRIAAAQASLDIIEHAMECPAEDFTACPDFQHKLAGQLPARLRS
jgi:MerR family transcriptional regulator, copper efflux regulator